MILQDALHWQEPRVRRLVAYVRRCHDAGRRGDGLMEDARNAATALRLYLDPEDLQELVFRAAPHEPERRRRVGWLLGTLATATQEEVAEMVAELRRCRHA